MNKAQNEYLEDLFSPYSGELRSFTKETFALYADRYNEIDPTPDTKKYVVRLAGGSNNDHATVNGVQYETKELAAQHIKRFVRDHMFEGSCKILSYNGQLEEVRYSMYEGGIVYKRWVEEVE